MIRLRPAFPLVGLMVGFANFTGCSGTDTPGSGITFGGSSTGTGGATGTSGATTQGGATTSGGALGTSGGATGTSGGATSGGATSTSGGALTTGGTIGNGGSSGAGTSGGTGTSGSTGAGGASGAGQGGTAGSKATGGATSGGSSTGGSGGAKASGGSGGTSGGSGGTKATGGASTGGNTSTGGSGGGGSTGTYACNGSTDGYNVLMIKNGSTWTVTNAGKQVYSGSDMEAALKASYASLSSGRTSKQSILVQGSGDIPAASQVSIPSYTVVNVCGTINVTGTSSGDKSPMYARNARDIEIPNLKMTGSPVYGIFFRGTNNIHLGQIDLRLAKSAGIGIRVDTSGSAGTDTTFNQNLRVDHVFGSGMGSHILETYGINNITIGTVEGENAGECGLLLNRSTNATIDLVSCDNCGAGSNYAAFRIANNVGKIGNDYPAGNIHVKKVYARRGGTGIFSVSGSGGLTVDEVDIGGTGGYPMWFQNCYNTQIATKSGTVSGGTISISNDSKAISNNTFPPSKNVDIQNITLTNGASLRQDYCEFGRNECSATNVTGGTVTLCP